MEMNPSQMITMRRKMKMTMIVRKMSQRNVELMKMTIMMMTTTTFEEIKQLELTMIMMKCQVFLKTVRHLRRR